jgi:cell division septation protein DedD
MKYLSLVLVLLMLSTAPSCKFLREKKIIGRKKTEQAELLEKQRQARVADSLRKVREMKEARESARLDSIRAAEEQKLAMASRYNIVVGAFITPEYARQWAEEYRSRGYNPEIIQMEGGRFDLVVVEAYDNAGEAVKRVNQFQDTVQIDAWIYRKK